MTEEFSLEARAIWDLVPQWAKEKVLRNVWCGQCNGTTEIVDFTGEAQRGTLIVKGYCGKCGGRVVRVI